MIVISYYCIVYQLLVLGQLRPEKDLSEGQVAELPGDVEDEGSAVDLAQ